MKCENLVCINFITTVYPNTCQHKLRIVKTDSIAMIYFIINIKKLDMFDISVNFSSDKVCLGNWTSGKKLSSLVFL